MIEINILALLRQERFWSLEKNQCSDLPTEEKTRELVHHALEKKINPEVELHILTASAFILSFLVKRQLSCCSTF